MLRWRCGRACAGLAWLLAGLPRAPCAAGADEARRGLRGAGGASAVERACAGLGVPPRESKQYAFYLGLSLARAAELGNAECLRAILALDAPPVDANVADHAGLTALAHAARRGDVAAAALLLPLTDVRCAAWACRAPVALASQEGHADLLELLLDAGAAADGADPEGRPPLHLASLGGHAAAAETLLERGADVHGRVAEDGRTALHRAASRGHAGVVAVLLRAGADPAAPDAWQHTAGHLAGQQGHAQVAATLDSLAQARAGRLGRELEVEKLRLLDMERRLAAAGAPGAREEV